MTQKKISEFIKYKRSEKAEWLRRHYPNAFLLLSLIAERARRESGHPDGLIIGDAMTGDPEEAGLKRQPYRTAIEKLQEFKIIKIISNGKKFFEREKSTIKITIRGFLVNLIDSGIWDINPKPFNQPINQRATNEQPTSNHKEEGTRKNKKEEDHLVDDDSRKNFSDKKEKEMTQENFTRKDLDYNCVRLKRDWTTPEMDEAWKAYSKRPIGAVTDPLAYLERIINTNRNKEISRCQRMKKTKTKNTPPLKKEYERCSASSLVRDTSEPTLAQLAQEMGVPIGPSFNSSKNQKIS
jgi:hypothetical protein